MLKKFRITVDGKLYSVTVEDMADEGNPLVPVRSTVVASAAVASATAAAHPAVTTSSLAAQTASDTGDIPSPLGGIVKELKVSVGQRINEGDIVVVLEAMKMNTNVFSNLTGRITAIHVKLGDAVDSGQVLLSVG